MCITFSMILETTVRSQKGLKFLISGLVPYLYKRLNFANFAVFQEVDSLIDKFQICVIGMAYISALSFHNLQTSFAGRVCF